MRRPLTRVSLASATLILAVASSPVLAYAETTDPAIRQSVDIGAGVITLVAALWLLVVALRLAKVSAGSTYAENIRYVVLGSLCLAGSVLATWSAQFMPDAFTVSQAQLGASLFIVAAIVLLAVYFTRVLRTLAKFMKAARAIEVSSESSANDDTVALVQDGPRGVGSDG